MGIIKRLLQLYIEHEVSSIANGAPITITDIQFNLFSYTSLKSTIILHDSIIHTPHQQKWKWESPLIARIGYARITFNLFSLIDLPPRWKLHWGIRMQSIKDIYSVELRDVQVFVEKRRNVFNFHLLDDRLDLPDAEEVLNSLKDKSYLSSSVDMKNTLTSNNDGLVPLKDEKLEIPSLGGRSSSVTSSVAEGISKVSSSSIQNDAMDHESEDAKRADELVTSIVQAVSSLGRAANEGGTKGLSNALRNQKDGFVSHLKKVQHMVALNSEKDIIEPNVASNKEKKLNKSIGIAKEGIQVIKHVGKVVEKNVLNMKEQVDALSKPPPVRKDWKPMENPELFRFGYFVLKDARIFTKDIIFVPGAEDKLTTIGKKGTRYPLPVDPTDDIPTPAEEPNASKVSTSAIGWSKPIAIKEVILFPSELCPPKDKEDPSTIGQPIEVYSNLVLERIFTEMATSSISGKLLNNVFTDVFALFDIANNVE